MNLQPVFIREQVIRSIRSFFEEQHFHEIITPTLQSSIPLEPNIFPFSTTWKTREESKNFYLATSPERGIKKMLGEGIGNCFSIGKSFRNLEGAGSKHIPEFLMLEWYREHADYHQIMEDVQELIRYVKKNIDNTNIEQVSNLQVNAKSYKLNAIDGTLEKDPDSAQSPSTGGKGKAGQNLSHDFLYFQGQSIDLSKDWDIFSLVDLFKKYTGLGIQEVLDEQKLKTYAQQKGYSIENSSWTEIYDQIFVNEIEDKLPMTPFFIIDFPARTSPLCKVNKEKPYLAERFECYMFGMELGNGNNENTDFSFLKNKFLEEEKFREEQHLDSIPLDIEFLNSLEQMSHSNFAGIGLGVDRLSMIMADTTDITDVEVFYK